MIHQAPNLLEDEDVVRLWTPKFWVYATSVLTIAILTAIIFAILILVLLPFVQVPGAGSTVLENTYTIPPIAFLMALGFHGPFTWLRVKNKRWILTNMAIIVQSMDDEEMRVPLSDVVIIRGIWPWNLGFSDTGSPPYTIEYVDMTWGVKTRLRAVTRAAKAQRMTR